MIVVGGGVCLIFHDLIPGAPSADDYGLVQYSLGIGGKENAGEFRFDHLLYNDMHRKRVRIKMMCPAVGQGFGALSVSEDFPDTNRDLFPRHPQEGFKLPGEGMFPGVLQRGAGADGKRCGTGETGIEVREDFFVLKVLIHAEKTRHLKACLQKQKEVFGF